MATTYPTSKQSLTNPNPTDSMQVVSHSANHQNSNDTVEALQDKVGSNGSAVQTTHDYKLSGITGSDVAASEAGVSAHESDTGNPHVVTHSQLSDKGTNDHTAIDSHIADGTLHFTEGSISHLNIDDIGTNSHADIDNHILSTSNPHAVTKTQIGLANVENTALSTWAGSANITEVGTLVSGDANAVVKRIMYVKAIANDTALATGDGLALITIPEELNGMNLVNAHAAVYTVSSSGLPTIQVHNLTDTTDMLTTEITIDASEFSSYTAATPPVIDAANDDVVTGDRLRIDVDVAGTGTSGLDVVLTFQLP
ncbi:MAG: hypothetical protein KAJ75_00080 [Alphaproteobacteria bacterium]|nr:hypothetical protein [Alphaproteobacteria bacterium]